MLAPVLAAALLSFAPPAEAASDVIVLLRARRGQESAVARSVVADVRARLHARPSRVYASAVVGFAASLTARQRKQLEADPRVETIVADETITLEDGWDSSALASEPSPDLASDPGPSPTASPAPTGSPNPTPSPTPPRPRLPTPGPDFQVVPTGVQRVGRATLSQARFNGAGRQVDVDMAIVDTGVASHPDLNVVGGYDCTGAKTWADGHGHGTHVAGTAAALDNGFGVVGVAPGARIWSVRVLDRNGVGKASWLLCGINWVTAQREGSGADNPLIEVVNMSLRFKAATSPTDDGNCGWRLPDPVHRSICRAVDLGITVVAAAGNDTVNAKRYRPAAYREVMTVSALSDFDGKPGRLGSIADSCPRGVTRDSDDVLANFSNYGRVIDIMAPGKCIWSTSKSGGYKSMSGTSMATPHVAGAVALYVATFGPVTPADVKRRLRSCGTSDWRFKSDRDRYHEPLLYMGRFCT